MDVAKRQTEEGKGVFSSFRCSMELGVDEGRSIGAPVAGGWGFEEDLDAAYSERIALLCCIRCSVHHEHGPVLHVGQK